MTMTANQLVAFNLRLARTIRRWTQEQAAERLETYLGTRWSKATFSAAERSAEQGTRTREFSADEILAFARTFGVPVGWFFLPPEGDEELPAISCGGRKHIEPHELVDVVLPHATQTSFEGPRLMALMRRPELCGEFDERIRDGVSARVNALAGAANIPEIATHIGNFHRFAHALSRADTITQRLFSEAVNELNMEEDTDG